MPMNFPTMKSLESRATQRNFRAPNENEPESEYREAFAKYMENVDRVEAAEIRLGDCVDLVRDNDPLAMLRAMGLNL